MTIGDKIRAHRKALNLTQTELGEKLGVKTNAVSKWECGRVEDIPRSKIKAMAELFNVPASYLIDEEAPTPISGGECSALDARLNELLAQASEDTKKAMIVLLEQSQKL